MMKNEEGKCASEHDRAQKMIEDGIYLDYMVVVLGLYSTLHCSSFLLEIVRFKGRRWGTT